MNSGSAMLTSAAASNTGVVHTGTAQPHCTWASFSSPCAAATSSAHTSTVGTA